MTQTINEQWLIYIAGPYTSKNPLRVVLHIIRAWQAALAVWKKGHVAICPHTSCAFMHFWLSYEQAAEGLLRVQSQCQATLFIKNWQQSRGSRKELENARELDQFCFFNLDEIPNYKAEEVKREDEKH